MRINGQNILEDSFFIRSFSPADFRASQNNYSVAEDENGILYFANENGVLEYDGSSWKLHSLPNFSYVVTVQAAPDGRIYIGAENEFGYLGQNFTGQLEYTSLRSLIDTKTELAEFWQIEFHDGEVFFQSYEGLVQYNGETAKFLSIEHAWFLPMGEEMFVHSQDKGLAKLEDGFLTYINTDLIFKKKENTFKSLKWIGSKKLLFTKYSGVFLLDTITFKSRRWRVPAHQEIVRDELCDAIIWNDSTYLLTTNKNGLKWMNKKGEIIKSITKEDGIETRQNSRTFRDTKGNLWLPADGIHHIIWPGKQKMDDFSTLIRSIVISDIEYTINSSSSSFESKISAPLTSAIFSFSSPGFDKTDLQYAYKLDGFDENWSDWTDNVNTSYTNLEGGTYTFHVKSRIVGGMESKPASLELIVPTLWYRTGWAYAGASSMAWLLIVGAFRYRTSLLKNQNKTLEEIIEERTREVRERNEELGNKNTELDNFIHRVSHDLIAPLRSIKGLVQILRAEETREGRDECLDLMESSVNKQEEFIKGTLEHSVNENKDIELEEIVLKDLCKEIIKDLTYYESAQAVDFKFQFSDKFKFHCDLRRVKIVLSNLVNNAVKYHNFDQAHPEITITARKEYEKTIIEVMDNGLGIAEEKLPEIFNMFYRVSSDDKGTGLGLYIVMEAMKKMNGTINVTSKLGKGSTFTLVLST